MFLTRLGEKSKMVVVGDITQIDLPTQEKSGLVDASTRFQKIPGIGFIELNETDVVRHPLVGKIVKAYNEK
jgi:phosphate starvation-inducible PhoH-like protein